jgi:hypothetical protein
LKIVSGDPKLPTKMATKLKIEKRGDEIFFKSSPLKLLSQSQPHQNLVLIELMVSDKKIFMGISHRVPC